MKKLILGLAASLLVGSLLAADPTAPALIPLPQKMTRAEGTFTLTPQTRIYADGDSRKSAELMAERLRRSTGYPLEISAPLASDAPVADGIVLTTKNADPKLGPEGYELMVAGNSVVIRAPDSSGLFYGTETLLQLFPPQIFSSNTVADPPAWQAPCVQIEDWPRFQWRGLMLDVSRHFYSKAEVEQILDQMALLKLNMFHWHLVDSQGWRIEIKKYPKLTQDGAWREQSDLRVPAATRNQVNIHPAWAKATPDKFGPDGRYGGFYTQDDIRQVVAYAKERRITIVPEIEMPGHSTAALSAYPEFGGFPDSRSTNHGVYNPANEGTFKFLDNVLLEVFQLFPGKYIHIGGDEVPKEFWRNSPECQALMKREGLKNEEQLQSWFIRRIETFVNAHGKTLVGWSEILQGGLATNAVVMDWIGGGKEAAEAGHDAVMTPTRFCYLNYLQSTNRAAEPRAQGGFISLRKVYSFDPVPADLPAPFQSHILGAQANLWTEWIASLPHAEYMLFPRLCALAEVTWSDKNARNWEDFVRRLKVEEERLDELGVKYHPGASEPLAAPRKAF